MHTSGERLEIFRGPVWAQKHTTVWRGERTRLSYGLPGFTFAIEALPSGHEHLR